MIFIVLRISEVGENTPQMTAELKQSQGILGHNQYNMDMEVGVYT